MTQPGMWQGHPAPHAPDAPAGGPGQAWPAYGHPAATHPAPPGVPYPPFVAPAPQQFPPPVRRPNPFAGVPGADYAADGGCVTALLATLLLPWTVTARGYSRPEVVVGVVLGVLAVLMPYLSRLNLFGRSWTAAKLRVSRIVLAAPLACCAATYFAIDAVLGIARAGVTDFAPAPGAWIAVAAATLAAVPRRSDLFDGDPPPAARFWQTVLSVIFVSMLVGAALAVAGVALTTFRGLAAVLELRALTAMPLVAALILGAWVVAVWKVTRPATHGDVSARLSLGAVGAGTLIWALLAAIGDFSAATAESVYLPFGAFALTMAAAVIACSPVLRGPHRAADAPQWLRAVGGVCGLIVVANVLLLVQVVAAVALTGALTAVVFATAACAGAGGVAADWARQRILRDAAGCRTPVLVAATVQAAAGVVLIMVTGLSARSWETIIGPQVIAALALPVAAALFVTLPLPMRAFFAAPRPGPPGAVQDWPEQTTSDAVLAADPATPAYQLYNLAQQDATLWPALAANPSTPQELLAWLAQSPDPAVHDALRNRQPSR